MDMMDILMAKALSGDGLPEVTTEDAGDILVVNEEGKWDKGEAGETQVVPNPEGEATETLNKLGIDDTVYGIPKELPAVTSADNGNVLTVVEGAWATAAASGGDVVYIKADLKPNFIIEFRSFTQKDIFDYINSKVDVVILVFDDEDKLTYQFVFAARSGIGQTLHMIFSNVFPRINEAVTIYMTFSVYNEQTRRVPYEIKTLNDPTELPDVTSEDAGKVLMVNEEGSWDKGNLPSSGIIYGKADKNSFCDNINNVSISFDGRYISEVYDIVKDDKINTIIVYSKDNSRYLTFTKVLATDSIVQFNSVYLKGDTSASAATYYKFSITIVKSWTTDLTVRINNIVVN